MGIWPEGWNHYSLLQPTRMIKMQIYALQREQSQSWAQSLSSEIQLYFILVFFISVLVFSRASHNSSPLAKIIALNSIACRISIVDFHQDTCRQASEHSHLCSSGCGVIFLGPVISSTAFSKNHSSKRSPCSSINANFAHKPVKSSHVGPSWTIVIELNSS